MRTRVRPAPRPASSRARVSVAAAAFLFTFVAATCTVSIEKGGGRRRLLAVEKNRKKGLKTAGQRKQKPPTPAPVSPGAAVQNKFAFKKGQFSDLVGGWKELGSALAKDPNGAGLKGKLADNRTVRMLNVGDLFKMGFTLNDLQNLEKIPDGVYDKFNIHNATKLPVTGMAALEKLCDMPSQADQLPPDIGSNIIGPTPSNGALMMLSDTGNSVDSTIKRFNDSVSAALQEYRISFKERLETQLSQDELNLPIIKNMLAKLYRSFNSLDELEQFCEDFVTYNYKAMPMRFNQIMGHEMSLVFSKCVASNAFMHPPNDTSCTPSPLSSSAAVSPATAAAAAAAALSRSDNILPSSHLCDTYYNDAGRGGGQSLETPSEGVVAGFSSPAQFIRHYGDLSSKKFTDALEKARDRIATLKAEFAADTTNTEFAYDFHEMSARVKTESLHVKAMLKWLQKDEYMDKLCDDQDGRMDKIFADIKEDLSEVEIMASAGSMAIDEFAKEIKKKMPNQGAFVSDGDITSMIKAGLRAQASRDMTESPSIAMLRKMYTDVLRDKQASRFGSHFTGNFERDMYSALGCKLGCSHHRGMQSSSGSSAAGNGGYGLSNIGTVVCERKECLANALACSVETGQFRAKESSAMIQRLYLQQQLLQQGHPLHAGNHGSGASEQYDALASTLAGRFSSPIAGNAAGFANSGVLAGAPAGLPTGCHDFVCEQCKCKKNHGGGAEAAAGQLTLSNGGGTSACISQGVRAMQRRDRRIMMANALNRGVRCSPFSKITWNPSPAGFVEALYKTREYDPVPTVEDDGERFSEFLKGLEPIGRDFTLFPYRLERFMKDRADISSIIAASKRSTVQLKNPELPYEDVLEFVEQHMYAGQEEEAEEGASRRSSLDLSQAVRAANHRPERMIDIISFFASKGKVKELNELLLLWESCGVEFNDDVYHAILFNLEGLGATEDFEYWASKMLAQGFDFCPHVAKSAMILHAGAFDFRRALQWYVVASRAMETHEPETLPYELAANRDPYGSLTAVILHVLGLSIEANDKSTLIWMDLAIRHAEWAKPTFNITITHMLSKLVVLDTVHGQIERATAWFKMSVDLKFEISSYSLCTLYIVADRIGKQELASNVANACKRRGIPSGSDLDFFFNESKEPLLTHRESTMEHYAKTDPKITKKWESFKRDEWPSYHFRSLRKNGKPKNAEKEGDQDPVEEIGSSMPTKSSESGDYEEMKEIEMNYLKNFEDLSSMIEELEDMRLGKKAQQSKDVAKRTNSSSKGGSSQKSTVKSRMDKTPSGDRDHRSGKEIDADALYPPFSVEGAVTLRDRGEKGFGVSPSRSGLQKSSAPGFSWHAKQIGRVPLPPVSDDADRQTMIVNFYHRFNSKSKMRALRVFSGDKFPKEFELQMQLPPTGGAEKEWITILEGKTKACGVREEFFLPKTVTGQRFRFRLRMDKLLGIPEVRSQKAITIEALGFCVAPATAESSEPQTRKKKQHGLAVAAGVGTAAGLAGKQPVSSREQPESDAAVPIKAKPALAAVPPSKTASIRPASLSSKAKASKSKSQPSVGGRGEDSSKGAGKGVPKLAVGNPVIITGLKNREIFNGAFGTITASRYDDYEVNLGVHGRRWLSRKHIKPFPLPKYGLREPASRLFERLRKIYDETEDTERRAKETSDLKSHRDKNPVVLWDEEMQMVLTTAHDHYGKQTWPYYPHHRCQHLNKFLSLVTKIFFASNSPTIWDFLGLALYNGASEASVRTVTAALIKGQQIVSLDLTKFLESGLSEDDFRIFHMLSMRMYAWDGSELTLGYTMQVYSPFGIWEDVQVMQIAAPVARFRYLAMDDSSLDEWIRLDSPRLRRSSAMLIPGHLNSG